MKIWKLECSHCGDPLYAWGYFKNKPKGNTTQQQKEFEQAKGQNDQNYTLASAGFHE